MEELRSTEVLDREILEDARKKAQKILKTADDSIRAQALQWEEKTKKALEDAKLVCGKRTREERDEILAKGPLERRRLRSEISQRLLCRAMNEFLGSLGRGELLEIMRRELRARTGEIAGLSESGTDPEAAQFNVIYKNTDEGEARALIAEFSGAGKAAFNFFQESGSGFPELIIDAPQLRITVSVEAAASDLLESRRAELASALLGPEALND